MTGIQTIIDSARAIEFTRGALVVSTMSRSGRLLTTTRNWTKPWTFTVTPRSFFKYDEIRSDIEAILRYDKNSTWTVKLSNNPNLAWMTEFRGSAQLGTSGYRVDASTNFSSSILTLKSGANYTLPAGTLLFKAGDFIQPLGHNYPYVVSEDVYQPAGINSTAATISVPLNRGLLPQQNYDMTGHLLLTNQDLTWQVKVTQLPNVQFVYNNMIQFSDKFELTEYIESVS